MKRNGKRILVAPEFDEALEDVSKQLGGVFKKTLTAYLGKAIKFGDITFKLNIDSKLKRHSMFPIVKTLKGKKGSFLDILGVLIVLFVMAIIFMYGSSLWERLEPTARATFDNTTIDRVDTLVNSFDYLYALVFFILVIGVLVLGFLVRVHPVFLVPFIILAFFGLIFAVSFSNVYETGFENQARLNSDNFPIQNFIMNNLPILYSIIVIVSGILIFGKTLIMPQPQQA